MKHYITLAVLISFALGVFGGAGCRPPRQDRQSATRAALKKENVVAGPKVSLFITGQIADRKRLRSGLPTYPQRAIDSDANGLTRVIITVAPDGSVREGVTLEASSGYAVLDDAVKTAVRTWQFAPLARDEAQVDQKGTVAAKFDLSFNSVVDSGEDPSLGRREPHSPVSSEAIRPARDRMAFGFDLFHKLVAGGEGRNVFISPTSISMALTMTWNGAAGTTQEAMAQVLGLQGKDRSAVNEANDTLRRSLIRPDSGVDLAIANSLWGRAGVEFKPEFLGLNRRYFGAEVTAFDFASPDAPARINKWVSDNTHGRIPNIVDQLQPAEILVLVNAVYFKGAWSRKFDKAQTQDRDFHLTSGTTRKIPMMAQSGTYSYLRGDGFQAVRLPYGAGRLAMYVFLPDETSGLQRLYSRLDVGQWQIWTSLCQEMEGYVVLPKFRLEYDVELSRTLSDMGMGVAFTSAADFSRMAEKAQFNISEVRHKTFVEVNEEGTEAAAVTSVGMVETSVRPRPFSMIIDRPFFCAICDSRTGEVLFMGSIADP